MKILNSDEIRKTQTKRDSDQLAIAEIKQRQIDLAPLITEHQEQQRLLEQNIAAVEKQLRDKGIEQPILYDTIETDDPNFWSTVASAPGKITETIEIDKDEKKRRIDEYNRQVQKQAPELGNRLEELNKQLEQCKERGQKETAESIVLSSKQEDLSRTIRRSNATLQEGYKIELQDEDFENGLLKKEVRQELERFNFNPKQINALETLHGINKCTTEAKDKCNESDKSLFDQILKQSSSGQTATSALKTVNSIQTIINRSIDNINQKITLIEQDIHQKEDAHKNRGFSLKGFFSDLKEAISKKLNSGDRPVSFISEFSLLRRHREWAEERTHNTGIAEQRHHQQDLKDAMSSMKAAHHASEQPPTTDASSTKKDNSESEKDGYHPS